jgi:hypothetical protein
MERLAVGVRCATLRYCNAMGKPWITRTADLVSRVGHIIDGSRQQSMLCRSASGRRVRRVLSCAQSRRIGATVT